MLDQYKGLPLNFHLVEKSRDHKLQNLIAQFQVRVLIHITLWLDKMYQKQCLRNYAQGLKNQERVMFQVQVHTVISIGQQLIKIHHGWLVLLPEMTKKKQWEGLAIGHHQILMIQILNIWKMLDQSGDSDLVKEVGLQLENQKHQECKLIIFLLKQ